MEPNPLDDTLAAMPLRRSRAEEVAGLLRRSISSGEIPPGERLGTKEDLKGRLGVAIQTLNEAVRVLQGEGLITARPGPGGGLFVAQPAARARLSHILVDFEGGIALLNDCMQVRSALEPLLYHHVAECRSDEDLREMRAHLDAMEASFHDPTDYLIAAWELHRRIAQSAHNQVLETMFLALLDLLREGLRSVEGYRFDPETDHRVHVKLVDAIAEAEPEALQIAIKAHDLTLVDR